MGQDDDDETVLDDSDQVVPPAEMRYKRHTVIKIIGNRVGMWECPFSHSSHKDTKFITAKSPQHFKAVLNNGKCHWCNETLTNVMKATNEWDRIEFLIIHYNTCPSRPTKFSHASIKEI